MMNNKNQSQEKPITEHSESSLAFNTRRKLVKGSVIAVPMVMTLRSGSALAASSSNRCIAQNQTFAQDRFDAGELPKFRNNPTNNVETFFRREVTRSRLIRIKRDQTDAFWIFDKNGSGNLRRRVIYNYGLTDPYPNEWLDTAANQKQYLAQGVPNINVYDSETTGPPTGSIVVTGEHFIEGNFNYVFEDAQIRIRHGLIMTTATGEIIMDQFGNPRIGRLVDAGTLNSMHLTTSCMTSLAP